MNTTKTRTNYWKMRKSALDEACSEELQREDLEDGWHRSTMCGKVARYVISFPGTTHAPVQRCKEHAAELRDFNPRSVATRI